MAVIGDDFVALTTSACDSLGHEVLCAAVDAAAIASPAASSAPNDRALRSTRLPCIRAARSRSWSTPRHLWRREVMRHAIHVSRPSFVDADASLHEAADADADVDDASPDVVQVEHASLRSAL